MRILTAELKTTRQILVGVPEHVEVIMERGQAWIVEPGSGVDSPRVLLTPTVALQRGMLIEIEDRPKP